MKRFPIQFAAVAGLLVGLCLLTWAGRDGAAAGAAPRSPAMRVALVDLEHVMHNYKKLEDLLEPLKEVATQAETRRKALAEKANKITDEIKSGEFENGSPELEERESAFFQLSSRIEALDAGTKKDLRRKQAQAYRDVYLEVQEAFREFATVNGYTLILQINRDALASDDARMLRQKMANPLVLNGGADDITDAVLEYLSSGYAKETATRKPAEPKPAAPIKTAPRKTATSPAAAPAAKATR